MLKNKEDDGAIEPRISHNFDDEFAEGVCNGAATEGNRGVVPILVDHVVVVFLDACSHCFCHLLVVACHPEDLLLLLLQLDGVILLALKWIMVIYNKLLIGG